MFGSSNVTSPSTTDVTTSIMMILTALGGTPHMLTNITSFLQTITEKPTEATSVVSKLISLLNFTELTSEASDLPTFSSLFNETEIYFYNTTEYNSSFLIDTNVPKEATLSSESVAEFGHTDNFINLTMEDYVDDNLVFNDKVINVSSQMNISEVKEDVLNNPDSRWNILNSDSANYLDVTSSNTISDVKNITFEITEKALGPESTTLSSEYHLNDTTDNFVSSESILPLNYVTVANLNFDEDNNSSSLVSVTESELLTSTLIAALTTLLAQKTDSSSSSEYIEQISQILQDVTTDFPKRNTDLSKCHSTQCTTVSEDASATIWEPSVTANTLNERQLSTSITQESTLTLEKADGRC
jgi:hypothetical protein